MAQLRQDEMREMVQSYFAASLDAYIEKLNDTGLPDRSLKALSQELAAHEDAAEGLTGAQWAESAPSLRHEMRTALRDQISRQDAADMKKPVQALPANRKTKPETLDLSLQDAIAVPGLPKTGMKTVNSYIDIFQRFWDWAEKPGRAPEKLFVDMKVKVRKKADDGRTMFTPAETNLRQSRERSRQTQRLGA